MVSQSKVGAERISGQDVPLNIVFPADPLVALGGVMGAETEIEFRLVRSGGLRAGGGAALRLRKSLGHIVVVPSTFTYVIDLRDSNYGRDAADLLHGLGNGLDGGSEVVVPGPLAAGAYDMVLGVKLPGKAWFEELEVKRPGFLVREARV